MFACPVNRDSCPVDRVLAVRSTGLSGRSTGDTATEHAVFRFFLFRVFFVCPIFPALFGNLFVCSVWLYEILTCRLSCPVHMAHKSFTFFYGWLIFKAKCKGHHGFLGFPWKGKAWWFPYSHYNFNFRLLCNSHRRDIRIYVIFKISKFWRCSRERRKVKLDS